MVSEILGTAAMGKLRGILKERYGMGLQIRFIQEITSPVVGEEETRLVGADLHFPILVGEKLLATAVLETGGKLQVAERETAGQLIRLFLEPELFSWYVEQVSNNFKVSSGTTINADVISIAASENDDSSSTGMTLGSNFICLETKNSQIITRISNVVHEISGRWAFLNLRDIQANIHTVADFRSLGAMTLAIDDIATVSANMQGLICQTLSDASPEAEPLFVIGVQTSLDVLEKEMLILPKLAQLLKTQKLEADRLPKDPRLLQESLEIMLEI